MAYQTSSIRKAVQKIKRRIAPLYYELVYALFTPHNVNTMNYGYAPVTPQLRRNYPTPDQGLQYELYYQTYKQLEQPLDSSQVLCEISSGRGGGLAFLRTLTEAKIIGLERSHSARQYAIRRFSLDCRPATAPDLPLDDSSIDVFVSVEAAHNYHNDFFVAELARCLKQGGYLILSDMHLGSDQQVRNKLRELYEKHGLSINNWRDIRTHILGALHADNPRKKRFTRYLFGPLLAEAKAYMGMVGTHKYHEMQNDQRAYFTLIAEKL